MATPVGADAAGPTDYQSEILAIDPPIAGIEVTIIGGDSFVSLQVEAGIEVLVIGYQGEPYLRFLPSGLVQENQLSPTKYLNEERFGESEVPSEADPDADPIWKTIDDDGSWTWHDHRTHWMNEQPPPGAVRGDQISEGVIPLFVDGLEVDVSVGSVWVDPPSPVPLFVGVLLGLLFLGLGLRKPPRSSWVVLAPLLVLGLVVGSWQVFSLPPETGPSPLNWLWPMVGLLALAGLPLFQRSDQVVMATGLSLVGGINLAIWGLMRRAGIRAAILPTTAPPDLDRLTVVLAILVGVGLSFHAVRALLNPARLAAT